MKSFTTGIVSNEQLDRMIKVEKEQPKSKFTLATGVTYGGIPPKSGYEAIGYVGRSKDLFTKCLRMIELNRKNRINISGVTVPETDKITSFLNRLPEADWTGKFGGMPTTPGYPNAPTFCPASIFTNLKRVFFSGVNILAAIKNAVEYDVEPGQSTETDTFRKNLFPFWKKWLDRVYSVHAKYNSSKNVVNNLTKILEYLMTKVTLEEFNSLFEKLAYSAVDPQAFYKLLNF